MKTIAEGVELLQCRLDYIEAERDRLRAINTKLVAVIRQLLVEGGPGFGGASAEISWDRAVQKARDTIAEAKEQEP